MKRNLLVVLAASAAVLGTAGVAGAAQIQTFSDGPDVVYGTPYADQIQTYGGDDFVDPGAGKDQVQTGDGDDTVNAADGYRDIVQCGGGYDTVTIDSLDTVQGCENVTIDKTVAPATVSFFRH